MPHRWVESLRWSFGSDGNSEPEQCAVRPTRGTAVAWTLLLYTTVFATDQHLHPAALLLQSAIDAVSVRPYGPVVDFSPDGRNVAYAVSGLSHAIYVMSLLTHTARRLGGDELDAWGPAWSPDGKKLAYFVTHGSSADVRVWDVASDETKVIDNPGISVPP